MKNRTIDFYKFNKQGTKDIVNRWFCQRFTTTPPLERSTDAFKLYVCVSNCTHERFKSQTQSQIRRWVSLGQM